MPIYAQSAPNEGESPAPDAHVAGAPPTDLTAAIIHYHDHIPTPIVITRAADGLILYANAAFAQLHRLPAAQLLGHFAPAWYAHPDDGQQLLQRLAREEAVRNFEVEGIRAGDGTHFWMSLAVERVLFHGQEAHLTVLQDVTYQHGMQDELATSERRFRLLAENGQDAIFRYELRPTPHFSYLSPATARLTGYTPDEFYARPALVYQLLTREQIDELTTLCQSGRPQLGPLEHLLRRKDRGQTWLECHYQLVYDERSTLIAVEGIARDITERKRVEEQSRLAAMGQLAAGIAHDFNNILSVILLHMELMQRLAPLTEGQQRHLKIVNQQVYHATNLVQQVLDFGRKTVVERRPVDVVDFVRTLVRQWERILAETITVEFFADQCVYWVQADPSRLQQALLNLMVNARDAMPAGGVLRLHLSAIEVRPGDEPPVPEMQPGSWVVLEVSDSGVGMPASVLAHLFEPFYTTKAPGVGTGLGLAQVYGIVQQHNGHIRILSDVGQGTTVCLYLPQIADRVLPLPEPEGVARHGRLTGVRILLAEDDAATRQGLQDALALLGCQVIAHADGEAAWTALGQHHSHVDLVLSDVVMPKLSGVELARRIATTFPQLKVVLLTGHPLHQAAQTALEAQQVSWLQKPVSLETLARTLEAALGHS